ncbi:hypothetical protein [Oryza sativa Japonica Group]|uniref:Uncharacterized protein n=1 Tax=Oryza sativa subsp. japonica TaxID=39947 RepID=Q5Z8E6_ORYSJ|nr:hypothetical protein [Oryza sativa Japonica Group]BAD53920.1 hypothetical protein [Oryza sativa Japonica Group]
MKAYTNNNRSITVASRVHIGAGKYSGDPFYSACKYHWSMAGRVCAVRRIQPTGSPHAYRSWKLAVPRRVFR